MMDQEIVGLCIERGVKNINHALDDTLLLGVAFVLMASRFKGVLDEFCMVSGSSLNYGKCHIYCWNTTPSLLNSISRTFWLCNFLKLDFLQVLGPPCFSQKSLQQRLAPPIREIQDQIACLGLFLA